MKLKQPNLTRRAWAALAAAAAAPPTPAQTPTTLPGELEQARERIRRAAGEIRPSALTPADEPAFRFGA